METTLKINEIFYSIQGESSYTGMPCIFIRLTGCNLRCTYCDTEYAFYDGKSLRVDEIITQIKNYPCNLVEITGGEPLMQKKCIELMSSLLSAGYSVLLETSGSLSLKSVPTKVIKIVDFKCPSSGMEKMNNWSIIEDIYPKDEIKFVIGDRTDFDWAIEQLINRNLNGLCKIHMSPVFDKINYEELASWILKSNLSIRFQIQLHKYIWSPMRKGV